MQTLLLLLLLLLPCCMQSPCCTAAAACCSCYPRATQPQRTCPNCDCVSFLAVRAWMICFLSSVDTRSSVIYMLYGAGVGWPVGGGRKRSCDGPAAKHAARVSTEPSAPPQCAPLTVELLSLVVQFMRSLAADGGGSGLCDRTCDVGVCHRVSNTNKNAAAQRHTHRTRPAQRSAAAPSGSTPSPRCAPCTNAHPITTHASWWSQQPDQLAEPAIGGTGRQETRGWKEGASTCSTDAPLSFLSLYSPL